MNDKEHRAPDDREARLNALLEGRLDAAETAALKEEATSDQHLATAIVEAYQLQRAMEHVGVERAPARLRRRLRRVPRAQRPLYRQPSWALALAAVPILLISVVLLQPQQPSQAEIEKARQDLAVAFAYIDRVGGRTFNRIEQEVGGELKNAVGGSVIKSIPIPRTPLQETQI